MTLTRLDSARYRRSPWKNGGGVTVDIAGASVPGGAPGAWEGVIWRFGQTRIEPRCRFKLLPRLIVAFCAG